LKTRPYGQNLLFARGALDSGWRWDDVSL